MDIIRRVIRRTKSGPLSLCVLRSTAEFYGWDTAFEEWSLPTRVDPETGQTYLTQIRKVHPHHPGGVRLRICRDASTVGNPAGKTNCFRLIGKFSNVDLKELAQVAGEKFEWMETRFHERRSRAEWLA